MTSDTDFQPPNHHVHASGAEILKLGSPPRPITRQVRSRAWREKHVRNWVTLFLVISAIMAVLAVNEGIKWNNERRIITEGIKITGTLSRADNEKTIPNHYIHPGDVVGMLYTISGVSYRENGPLMGFDRMVQYREPIEIHVDPKNPKAWTSRTTPLPLWHALLGSLILAPIAFVLVGGAIWNRQHVLKMYRIGELAPAEVVSVKQAILGPNSRVVRCIISGDAGQGRMFTTILPARSAGIAPGEIIWLLALPGRVHKGVPAALFE